MSPAAQAEFNRLMDNCNSTSIRQPRTLCQMFDAAAAQGWLWFTKGTTEFRRDRTTGRWHASRPAIVGHGKRAGAILLSNATRGTMQVRPGRYD